MEESNPVIKNVDVGVKDELITFNTNNQTAVRTIDGTGKVLIPGMYNCHAHSPMTLLRGFANDTALEDWLFNHIFPAEQKIKGIPNAVYTGATLAIAEMIASGTIAFNEMYFGLPLVAKAVEEAGVRANLCNAVLSFEPDNYDYTKSSEYEETAEILNTYHKAAHGRIKANASLHCAYTTHPAAWQQVTEFAKKHEINMQVHISESLAEHNKSIEMFGMTPVEAFSKYGVFDVPTVAAHACWVTEDDIQKLAHHNVTVAHNPVYNLKLASGTAPIDDMQKKGINITLGTDGVASNNSHDLFEEIKLASILQKRMKDDPTAVPALSAIKMATVNGAKAFGNKLGGIIKEGYEADLVMLDFNNPRQIPCYDPLVNLAYSTTGRDVVMTLCQGKILYEHGEFKTIDIEKVMHEAKGIGEKICP